MKKILLITIACIVFLLMFSAMFPNDIDLPEAALRVKYESVYAPTQTAKNPFVVPTLDPMFYGTPVPYPAVTEEIPPEVIIGTKDPGER